MEKSGGTVAGEAKLSPQALDTLRSLDSLSYGLLDLQTKGSEGLGGGAGRERVPVTRDLIKQGISHLRASVAKFSHSPHTQAQVISLIAHLHLLLDEFTHAYSAYSQYRQLSPSGESDPALFYGLGIIHRCHGQHKHSEESYRKVLSLAPSFPRSGEVHLQLGLLLKRRRALSEAAAHLEKALDKPDPQLDKFLIQFQLAHISELQCQVAQAKNKYEVLLGCRTISSSIKALTQKQLGWLLHRWPEVGEGERVRDRALELLKLAAKARPLCGETWYLLGRVLVAQQKCHEAFSAYQKAIHFPSKVSSANTWHSIGHLYFQMHQPRDSLQAYLCCVFIDIFHFQGWKSLGCLYEAVVYPTEALICYQNAIIASVKKGIRMGKDIDYVRSRAEALSQYLLALGTKSFTKTPGMPPLSEAWATLVPSHIRKKQLNPGTPLLMLSQCSQPSSALHPSPSSSLTPTASGPAVRVTGNGNFSNTATSDNRSSSLQNGNSNLGAPECSQTGMVGGALDLNLDNLDFEALAAAASAIPSPASLSARSKVTVSSTPNPQPAAAGHPQSLASISPPNPGLTTTLPPTSFQSSSFPHTPTVTSPSLTRVSSFPSLSGSHTTDMVWGQQSVAGNANWPSYLVGSTQKPDTASCFINATFTPPPPPPFPQDLAATHGLSRPPLSSLAQSAVPHWTPPPAVKSLSPSEEKERKSTGRKRRSNSSSHSQARSRQPSVSSPTLLLAPGPSLAGFSGIKTEISLGAPPSIPPNLASDPFLLSQIQAASHQVGVTNTIGVGFNSSQFSSSTFGGPSFGQLHHASVNQMVPQGTTVVNTPTGVLFRQDQRFPPPGSTTESGVTPTLPPPTTARNSGHFGACQTMQFSTTAPIGAHCGTISQAPAGITEPPLTSKRVRLSSDTPSTSSLVDQLYEALQEKKSCGEGDRSPSESSSGISSAGTNVSAFFTTSTAESSPVDCQSLTTLASLSHIVSPRFPTSPSHTASGATDRPQLSPCGPPPRGGSDQKCTKSELQNNNGATLEGQRASDDSKLISPRVPFPSLAPLKEYMILEPELRPPNPPPFQPGMELRPHCPLYKVGRCDEFDRLLEFCHDPSTPICLISGVVEAISLDLSLFSSQCLVETCANHEMEVREQMKQAVDENSDVVSGRQVWKCESSKSVTTVAEYARYQQNMLQKEREEDQTEDGRASGEGGEREFLSFGTNVDISDESIWSNQLNELNKLPPFLRVTCPETNLLSHIRHTVLGMNSVQLYMKVAGSRTPGHQENNNFCSLNINIGPGTCEWFAVPNSYWGVLHRLCEKHKVNFLVGSWWPVLEELYQHKVPVYRFTQRKGEVVFINPGTIHWVQANSACNNIAWNTGPLTAHQFRMAWERYQWNKVQKVLSIVPMVHLTWNLARRIRLNDSHFYWQVRSLLESSLAQTNLLLSHLSKAGIPVLWHGRLEGEPAPHCNNCAEEVFNVLFVLSHRGEYLVYCHRCASSMKKTFTVLQQYKTEELKEVLATFSLHLPDL